MLANGAGFGPMEPTGLPQVAPMLAQGQGLQLPSNYPHSLLQRQANFPASQGNEDQPLLITWHQTAQGQQGPADLGGSPNEFGTPSQSQTRLAMTIKRTAAVMDHENQSQSPPPSQPSQKRRAPLHGARQKEADPELIRELQAFREEKDWEEREKGGKVGLSGCAPMLCLPAP